MSNTNHGAESTHAEPRHAAPDQAVPGQAASEHAGATHCVPDPAVLSEAVYVLLDPGIPAYGSKGASVHVQAVLRELVQRAARVTLVTCRVGGNAPEGLEGVEVIELPRPKGATNAEREQAIAALDEQAAQVVEELVAAVGESAAAGPVARTDATARSAGSEWAGAEQVVPLVYQRYSLFSGRVMERARAAGARTILEVNAPLVDEQREHRDLDDAELAEHLTLRALTAPHSVVAVSSKVAQWAQEQSGRPVHVVPNGVDLASYRTAAPDNDGTDEASRGDASEHTTPTGDATGHSASRDAAPAPVAAFVGGFRPWHDSGQLVRSAAELKRRGTPVSLLLVGDGPCLAEVLADAERVGVEVRSTGQVTPAEVPGLLARADIALAPYPAGDAYFSPLKVAEYLAAGLPSVLSAVADLPELIREGEALLVAPGDDAAFTDALGELAADPLLRRRMSRSALVAAQRFTWSAAVEKILTSAGVHARTGSGR